MLLDHHGGSLGELVGGSLGVMQDVGRVLGASSWIYIELTEGGMGAVIGRGRIDREQSVVLLEMDSVLLPKPGRAPIPL